MVPLRPWFTPLRPCSPNRGLEQLSDSPGEELDSHEVASKFSNTGCPYPDADSVGCNRTTQLEKRTADDLARLECMVQRRPLPEPQCCIEAATSNRLVESLQADTSREA